MVVRFGTIVPMVNDKNILSAQSVSFKTISQVRLRAVSFSVGQGESLLLKGKNGSGKTTLLFILAGFLSPTAGQLHLSKNLQKLYIGHFLGLHPLLSVKENYASLYNKQKLEVLAALAQKLGVPDINTPIHKFSFGQQKKASLLKLWLDDATLWLLDEPFNGLDKAAQAIIADKITLHSQNAGTTILTNHYFEPSRVNNRQVELQAP